MSLIKCSECGKEYSDKAAGCPNCGCPTSVADNRTELNFDNPEKKKKSASLKFKKLATVSQKKLIITACVLYLIGISCFIYGISNVSNDLYDVTKNEYEAYSVSYVRNKKDNPVEAEKAKETMQRYKENLQYYRGLAIAFCTEGVVLIVAGVSLQIECKRKSEVESSMNNQILK